MTDCTKCEYNYVCCATDAWKIPLSAEEAARISPRVKLPNGQFVLASKRDGTCYFLEDGKCLCYNDRPSTCKRFDCSGKKEIMLELLDRLEGIQANLDAAFAGYLVAFVYPTSDAKNAGELVITNPDNGKEIKLVPQQIFGKSEDEVKRKMIETLKQPFKKEDI